MLIAIAICISLGGCGDETKPRPLAEIDREAMELPALFMTASGNQVSAAANRGVFVDEQSGELAWPTYTCLNPKCPARQADESGCIFIWPDPRFFVKDDGTLGMRAFASISEWNRAVEESGGHRQPTCLRCLEIRNLSTESRTQQQQYTEFVKPYDLPATIERRKELNAERKRRREYINRRTGNL